jgi:leader peptidase (prepilin peptidase)/N-methyltransferase
MTAAIAICAALGLVLGPVLDLVITRVPAKQPLRGPAAAGELRRGRAAVLSLLGAVLLGAVGARFHDSWALPAFLVLTTALIALSWIDLEHFILPNRIVFPLSVVMPVLLVVAAIGDRDPGALVRAGLGGIAAFAALFVLHLISPRSMGFGDVKLAFVLGLGLGWLGWGELVLGLFLAFLYGALIGVALILLRRRGRKDHVPFGPFLALGTMTAILWGEAILDWYQP